MTLFSLLDAIRRNAPLGARGRLIVKTGGWSFIAKVAAATNLFLSIPFVLRALGPIEFGAWATLVSLVMFAGFLDFGFGNGTMNLVAAAHGRGDAREIGAVVSEGRRTLVRIALGLATAFILILPWIPWHRLLGLPQESETACRLASAAVLFSIVLAVPLNLATRIQLGLGQGDRAFRWQAAGQIATLGIVIASARAGASLPLLTAAAVFTPLLASLGNTLELLRDSSLLRTTTRHPDLARRIHREGVLFFVLQLSAALAFSADLPLISAIRGPAEAGTYAIVQRLFSVIPLGLSLVWAPLWPSYRHALAAGHHAWVKRTLRHSVALAMSIAGVASLLIFTCFHWIAHLWLHRVILVPALLLAGFAVWAVLESGGTAISTFLNAASVMRFQVITTSIFSILCFGFKALVVTNSSIEWLPWVTVVIWSSTSALPFLLLRRRIFNDVFERRY